MAMKLLRSDQTHSTRDVARFVEEARVTAQLGHPGVVPVHAMGRLEDGRLFFTMEEVTGETLTDVLSSGRLRLRRLVSIFHQVCETMAFAHDRGVVHCDLKPDNIMIGAYGEVRVLDWGLALTPDGDIPAAGAVSGTPAWMPPEQARGHSDLLDCRADVYALGAILYRMIVGRPPYEGSDAHQILARVIAGAPDPLVVLEQYGGLENLSDICRLAMAREPAARFPSASGLVEAVEGWLDGAQRREAALRVVDRSARVAAEAEELGAGAKRLRARSQLLLADVQAWETIERKVPGWELADEAEALEREVSLKVLESEQLLRAALTHDPELPEAHAALVARYREQHARRCRALPRRRWRCITAHRSA